MSCVLSHPISGQILVLESGFPALLYTSLNDLNVDLNTGTRITLKSYSNLYVLESTDSSNNIYPTGIGFVANSGLPNGLGLLNYNTITGKINGTGTWKVATRYLYPNNPNPVSKIFTIVSKLSGGAVNSYPLPNFETVFTGEGEPVFPINGPNGLEIPTLENDGSITFTPITEIITESAFIESEGPTLQESEVPQEPPPPPPAGGGDPVNYIPLRVFSNLSTDSNGIITGFNGFNCNWAESRYIDTRTRTENFFIGRIGNRYVRVDTETTRGFNNTQLGIIKGIKFSQGILTPSGNGYLPYGIETGSTTYFILTGLLPNNSSVASSLIRKDLNGPYIDIFQNGTGVSLGNEFPTGVPRLANSANFNVQINVGLGNITALRFNWQVDVFQAGWRTVNDAILGGFYSCAIGDLHSFDQVGGSFIEQLNYTYELCPYNHTAEAQVIFSDFTGIQGNEPWTTWGETLKWVELTPKTKHFYGLNWLIGRAWLNSGNPILNNSPIMSGLNWKRNDPGFVNSSILIDRNITWNTPCFPLNLGGACLPCDPTCNNFNGDFGAFNNALMGNVNGAPMSQAFADCLGLVSLWQPSPSTTSSQSFSDLINLLEELN
jgi:hypothetical protein